MERKKECNITNFHIYLILLAIFFTKSKWKQFTKRAFKAEYKRLNKARALRLTLPAIIFQDKVCFVKTKQMLYLCDVCSFFKYIFLLSHIYES